jgi:hypothetical protein
VVGISSENAPLPNFGLNTTPQQIWREFIGISRIKNIQTWIRRKRVDLTRKSESPASKPVTAASGVCHRLDSLLQVRRPHPCSFDASAAASDSKNHHHRHWEKTLAAATTTVCGGFHFSRRRSLLCNPIYVGGRPWTTEAPSIFN